MLDFLRMSSSFGPKNHSPGGRGETQGASVRPKVTRRKPSPLHLAENTEQGAIDSNSNWTNLPENGEPLQPQRPLRIREAAALLPYYHAHLSEDQEEYIFQDHLANTGSFLVRDSKSNSSAVTVSVVIDPVHLYHFQVVQSGSHFEVVGVRMRFKTLEGMIDHFKLNGIPGKSDDQVCLTYPIPYNRDKLIPSSPSSVRSGNGITTPDIRSLSSPSSGGLRRKSNFTSPTTSLQDLTQNSASRSQTAASPQPDHVPRTPPRTRSPVQQQLVQNQAASSSQIGDSRSPIINISIDRRPPMPIPRSPPVSRKGHIYSEAADPDLDRIKMVLELCRQSDLAHTSRKKCTCGLYLEESTLTQGWMMHIDNEPGKTQGRIFFLDTKSNQTTWTLPQEIEEDLKANCPVKWDFMRDQMKSSKQKN